MNDHEPKCNTRHVECVRFVSDACFCRSDDRVRNPEMKYKVLMFADHALSTSGVGTQSRYLINGLVSTGKYSFRQLGAAVKHADYQTVVVNQDFIIKPIDGFGNQDMVRQLLIQEKPDAVMLFTDPRFYGHIFNMEDEIHQICPIVYNHLWDEAPVPQFNKAFYESCDLINCINYHTYEFVNNWFPDRTNYVPHAVPSDLFKRMSDDEAKSFKVRLIGKERADHFVFMFVSRNARRKMPSDVIYSFKLFLEELQEKQGHKKSSLIFHADPTDPEGPNLIQVVNMLGVQDHVIFSKDRIGFHEMNALYNVSDCVVNISCNEGFGLSVLEAKMAERVVIANKTGGLTRQIIDHETGFEYGVAIEPAAKCLVGNQHVPYIFEHITKHDDVRDAMIKIYDMTLDRRREIGKKAREHCLKHYNLDDLIKSWDETLTSTIQRWRAKQLPNNKRWRQIEM